MPRAKNYLSIIVTSQFLCTSLWFAGNAVMPDLAAQYHIPASFLAHITSAVQLGFISGTLLFAVFTIADRFSPVRVFFAASVAAGICNLGTSFNNIDIQALLSFRFLTGFFLAGIYPVGMKIAADHYDKGLGKSLGFLVGALVLGTALPHLLKSFTLHLPWKSVIVATTILSFAGGACMLIWVPNGPYRKAAQKLQPTAFLSGFLQPSFRSAAFGYFGHMWELYTFWAFLPVLLLTYQQHHASSFNISLTSFLVIGSGSLGCAMGGLLSQYFGPKKIASTALFASGCCCVLSPFVLMHAPPTVLFPFLFFWGIMVTADSPLFSTLVAQNAPAETRGTSLTIVNCIGFFITIISIQVMRWMMNEENAMYIYTLLAAGPLLGLLALLLPAKNTNGALR